MMTAEPIKLAQALVKLPWWRWMPGMLTLEEIVPPAITLGWDPARVLHADPGDVAQVCTLLGKVRDIHDTALPDLTDPATFGCLLALADEQYPHGVEVESSPCRKVRSRAFVWGVHGLRGSLWKRTALGDKPGTALARAILAAPPPV